LLLSPQRSRKHPSRRTQTVQATKIKVVQIQATHQLRAILLGIQLSAMTVPRVTQLIGKGCVPIMGALRNGYLDIDKVFTLVSFLGFLHPL
jgi:hypothetical protein